MTDADHVVLLEDPIPPGATVAGQWWPPRWLEPGYLRSRIADIDVLHVHFGFDSHSPDTLAEVCAILAAHRVPLVVTVHDLCNPHLTDEDSHRARLDVLVPAASTVITLTQGAANVIRERWQRRALVLPHPHLLPIGAVGAARQPRERPIVGVHAKHLRANIDPWPILDCLLARGGDYALRLDLDDNALSSPRADDTTPHRLAGYEATGVDVRIHAPFTDSELVDYLTEIDVMVLPYRFGTHSGWVEACHDAGVLSVVPDCGFFDEQQPGHTFGYDRRRLDEASLIAAVDDAVRQVYRDAGAVDHGRRHRRKAQCERVRHEVVRSLDGVIAAKRAA